MIQAGDLRKSSVFEYEGNVYTVIDFQHVKNARGGAIVRLKIKNIVTGQVKDVTFNPTDRFENGEIEKREMQYLYHDDQFYYFMDTNTYDQLQFDENQIADTKNFLTDGLMVTVYFYKDRPYRVEPPVFVNMLITYCEPAVAGDTQRAATKPATLETGLVVEVPLFVNQDETIKIDTRTSTYVERV